MDDKTKKEIARKGGLAVSQNREHMAKIGSKGGKSTSQNVEHMAEIGKKGGEAGRGRGLEEKRNAIIQGGPGQKGDNYGRSK